MEDKKFSVGIDSGSRNTKIVVYDVNNSTIIHREIFDSQFLLETEIDIVLSEIYRKLLITNSQVERVVSTGYGRKKIFQNPRFSSEIVCHSIGCNFYQPVKKTIIDIGGQDSKIILSNSNGKVDDFIMNDKCAAGTGRFIERVFDILNLNFNSKMISSEIKEEILEINNTCVVFAESEIIGLISKGIEKERIIQGVFLSIAKRIKSMASQIEITSPIVLTGGTAGFTYLKTMLELVFHQEIVVTQDFFYTGAIGASLSTN